MPHAVAVDIGGTFTDLVAYDHDSRTVIYTKSPTTYGNLVEGLLDHANPQNDADHRDVAAARELRKLRDSLNQPTAEPLAIHIYAATGAKHSMSFKLEDFMMPEFDFGFYALPNGKVIDYYLPGSD